MNKISFIIEFDEVSKTQEEQLTEFIEKTGIKFHVLENDNDLKEYEKYKEVIDKTKMRISAIIKKYQQKIDNEIDMGSQGDHFKICRYEENIKFLKDILKEVK